MLLTPTPSNFSTQHKETKPVLPENTRKSLATTKTATETPLI
jgi:hypothetical protein